MSSFAKYLIGFGFLIVLIGVIILALNKIGIPLGKLPGDIHFKKERFVFYFPIITSIIISIGLTILINVIIWLFKK